MNSNTILNETSEDKRQQNIKDHFRKEKTIEQARKKCRVCHKYLLSEKANPKCTCVGMPEDEDSHDNAFEKISSEDETIQAKTKVQIDEDIETKTINDIYKLELILELKPELPLELLFNAKIISELLEDQILVINNDMENGMLSLKLQYNPELLPEEKRNELNKFVFVMLHELNSHRNDNNITENCYVIVKDKRGNTLSLLITLPNTFPSASSSTSLYEAYINRLANKQFLPQQVINQKANEKIAYEKGMNHFNPTPFSMKPTPEKQKQQLQEEQTVSSVRPRSLVNRFKPKNF